MDPGPASWHRAASGSGANPPPALPSSRWTGMAVSVMVESLRDDPWTWGWKGILRD